MSKRIILVAALSVALLAAAAGVLVSTARATYPGDVGRLSFGMTDSAGNPNVFTVLPNGAGPHQLTTGDGLGRRA